MKFKKNTIYSKGFSKSMLAVSIASSFCAPPSFAANDNTVDKDTEIEVIQVSGIRGSQYKSVNIKRHSDGIVDAISAEDIGKLPDATISDSLQRITGVQINRSAGEGSSVNIRGLPQVGVTINGEKFITANSIFQTRPNFKDIPSTLFSGATVIKSRTASQASGGISGMIDLQTFRPFDLDDGLTATVNADVTRGSDTEETDPSFNGLVGWNDDTMGFVLSASVSESTLRDSSVNSQSSHQWNISEDMAPDFSGDGVNGPMTILLPNRVRNDNQIQARDRTGLNASFQYQISDSLQFTADVFYTDMDEDQTYLWYEQRANIGNTPTAGRIHFDQLRDTGIAGPSGNYHTVDRYTYKSALSISGLAQAVVREMDSLNASAELKFDDGGDFTGSVRVISSEANWKETQNSMDMEHWTNPDRLITDYINDNVNGKVPRNPNPAQEDFNPTISFGETPSIEGLWAATDPANVAMKTGWGNVNEAESSMDAIRFDGSYDLDKGIVKSVDFGVRKGSRQATYQRNELVSPYTRAAIANSEDMGQPAGLWDEGEDVTFWARWRASDAAHLADNKSLVPYRTLSDFQAAGFPVTSLTDFPINGVPSAGALTIDPSYLIDHADEFHTFWGEGTDFKYLENAGRSYRVKLEKLSYYAQFNVEGEIGSIPYSGNFGIQVIETDLTVRQNITDGQTLAPEFQFKGTNLNPGNIPRAAIDVLNTERSYTDYLPSFNLALFPHDDVILRFAYSKNMADLDLNNWGEGLDLSLGNGYRDEDTNPVPNNGLGPTRASQRGNPELDPWRSENIDLSVEWYPNDSTMLSIGLFKIDVKSFLVNDEIIRTDFADGDGINRKRPTPTSIVSNGVGGDIHGVEFSFKQGLDFLDGVWGNFGYEFNYTFAPSSLGTDTVTGETLPFIDSSKHQTNIVGWYDDGTFQVRLAYNIRSERNADGKLNDGNTQLFQDGVAYLDASISYNVFDNLSFTLNGSNLTEEQEDYYGSIKSNFARSQVFERRVTLGARYKF